MPRGGPASFLAKASITACRAATACQVTGKPFLKKPKILIMDEATSALDNQSQGRIQNLLDTHWKGKSTLIAVIHRLDIIKGYDKIGVMKTGKIEEMGSYDELMAKKGLLYELTTGRN